MAAFYWVFFFLSSIMITDREGDLLITHTWIPVYKYPALYTIFSVSRPDDRIHGELKSIGCKLLSS